MADSTKKKAERIAEVLGAVPGCDFMTTNIAQAVLREVKQFGDLGRSVPEVEKVLLQLYNPKDVRNAVVELVSHGLVEVGPDWRMRAK